MYSNNEVDDGILELDEKTLELNTTLECIEDAFSISSTIDNISNISKDMQGQLRLSESEANIILPALEHFQNQFGITKQVKVNTALELFDGVMATLKNAITAIMNAIRKIIVYLKEFYHKVTDTIEKTIRKIKRVDAEAYSKKDVTVTPGLRIVGDFLKYISDGKSSHLDSVREFNTSLVLSEQKAKDVSLYFAGLMTGINSYVSNIVDNPSSYKVSLFTSGVVENFKKDIISFGKKEDSLISKLDYDRYSLDLPLGNVALTLELPVDKTKLSRLSYQLQPLLHKKTLEYAIQLSAPQVNEICSVLLTMCISTKNNKNMIFMIDNSLNKLLSELNKYSIKKDVADKVKLAQFLDEVKMLSRVAINIGVSSSTIYNNYIIKICNASLKYCQASLANIKIDRLKEFR